MIDDALLLPIIHSLKDPLLFVDTTHTIRFMNRAAVVYYSEGDSLLGQSLLDCHNVQSQQVIVETLADMQNGLDERLITDNEKHRIYMRAVRDDRGGLLGYYERYEPPRREGLDLEVNRDQQDRAEEQSQ